MSRNYSSRFQRENSIARRPSAQRSLIKKTNGRFSGEKSLDRWAKCPTIFQEQNEEQIGNKMPQNRVEHRVTGSG